MPSVAASAGQEQSIHAGMPIALLQVMFSDLLDSVVSSPPLRSFMDVLCQGTSGAPAADISAAYMVRAFAEMYQPGACSTSAHNQLTNCELPNS